MPYIFAMMLTNLFKYIHPVVLLTNNSSVIVHKERYTYIFAVLLFPKY